jgi:hypothetical protein
MENPGSGTLPVDYAIAVLFRTVEALADESPADLHVEQAHGSGFDNSLDSPDIRWESQSALCGFLCGDDLFVIRLPSDRHP